MENKERKEMIMSWLRDIDFMKNYRYDVVFPLGRPVIQLNQIHKRDVRKLNKALRNANMEHIKVIADTIIKPQNNA